MTIILIIPLSSQIWTKSRIDIPPPGIAPSAGAPKGSGISNSLLEHCPIKGDMLRRAAIYYLHATQINSFKRVTCLSHRDRSAMTENPCEVAKKIFILRQKYFLVFELHY